MKRLTIRAAALLTLICALACGCAAPAGEAGATPAPTQVPFAPVDDSMAVRVATQIVYYLSPEGSRLKPMVCEITVMPGETILEAVMQKLLETPEAGEYLPLFAESEPVYLLGATQSRGVASVDLTGMQTGAGADVHAEARRMYLIRAAITNTLTELADIRYVNLLIDGIEQPLYWYTLSRGLPTGAMTRVDNIDVGLMEIRSEYESIRPSGESGDAASGQVFFTRHVALYFAAREGGGVLPEMRSIELDSDNYVQPVIEALIRGPNDAERLTRTLPAGIEINNAGIDYWQDDIYIVINFRAGARERIERSSIDARLAYGSIVHTLMDFVPGAKAVRFQVDGEDFAVFGEVGGEDYVDEMTGVANRWPYTREDFPLELGREITLYVPLADGRLRPVYTSVTQVEAASPRNWLRALFAAAGGGGELGAFPAALDADAVLGIAIHDEMMLLNLSQAAADGLAGAGPGEERAWVYAIVNTLCGISGVRSVRFLVEGAPVETFAGGIWLREALLPSPGLVEK